MKTMLHRQTSHIPRSLLQTCVPSSNLVLKLAVILIVLPLLSSARVLAAQFEVLKVIDGNTLVVRDEKEGKISVRLVGIEAPAPSISFGHPSQPFSQRSAKHLASLVLGRVVDIRLYGLDGFGRQLGEVFASEKNINLEMVRAGFAEVYRGKPAAGFDLDPYWEAEKEAKEAHRGMWGQGDQYVSAREWKK